MHRTIIHRYKLYFSQLQTKSEAGLVFRFCRMFLTMILIVFNI